MSEDEKKIPPRMLIVYGRRMGKTKSMFEQIWEDLQLNREEQREFLEKIFGKEDNPGEWQRVKYGFRPTGCPCENLLFDPPVRCPECGAPFDMYRSGGRYVIDCCGCDFVLVDPHAL